ncbi:hypothetical protein KY290_000958 [Solanum tuberosum]|uniref:Ulp1 protease family, C-terminal catalytic domain containing protein n=1 Tax=Solanum tuberosum TaxID=4113 RepID=A0ABQ7WKX8_SOLTU|nr:hypothetical protein KY290_000958 [Solanum tuberosum]
MGTDRYSIFLTGFEASKTTIPKLYFDLVETGQYVNIPWGTECFRLTLKACSHKLGNNPTSFKFRGFHLALQIWFYECCLDNTIVIRVANGTPRIFNWKTSNKIIFFVDLKNIIFRTYGNHLKFKNIVLMIEEMNAIDPNNLHESCSHHKTENQATLERNDVDSEEKYVDLKNEIADAHDRIESICQYFDKVESMRLGRQEVNQHKHHTKSLDDAHQHVEETEKVGMDPPLVSMREYVDISNTDAEAQNPIEKTVDGVSNADIPGSSTSKPPSLDDYLDLTMKKIVQLDPILNVTTTPDVQPRNRNHGKYDTSPYIRLSEGESSVRRGSIFSRIKHPFESHNGFQVADDLIDEFSK